MRERLRHAQAPPPPPKKPKPTYTQFTLHAHKKIPTLNERLAIIDRAQPELKAEDEKNAEYETYKKIALFKI